MLDPRRSFKLVRFAALSISVLAMAVMVACQTNTANPASRPIGAAPGSTAKKVPVSATSAAQAKSALRDALLQLDADTLAFHNHVVTLANPFFEGRSADTRGNQLAAEYLRFHFSDLELQPAFENEGQPEYYQAMTVPGDVVVDEAVLATLQGAEPVSFEHEVDFNPVGLSGSGKAAGQAVFVGYSIAEGPENYSNYSENDDLTGKIAVMFRFEPMTAAGKSKWGAVGGGAWSRHSGLTEKIAAAASRGAAGVIMINPPGADDPRARELDSPSRSRFASPVAIPVAAMTSQAGSRLLKSLDIDGRDAMAFRKLADSGVTATPLGSTESSVTLKIEMRREPLATNNVGAILPGKGSLADQYIVIGAHYDHVGYGYVGGAMPSNQGILHPGADDNASGTAALLIIAGKLNEYYKALPADASARSVMFLGFTAEEMGLLGSAHFVKNSPIDASAIYTMINIDMVGKLSEQGLEIGGVGTAEGFEELLKPMFDASGVEYKTSATGVGPSDHASFHRAGSTVLFFFTGTHPDYHRPGDLSHKVNFEGAVRVINLITNVAEFLAMRPEALIFKQTSGAPRGASRSGSRVRLGIMPADYTGEEPGVLIGDVFDGTSAALGGMKKDDRLIKWDGRPLPGVVEMMGELAKHKPGDVVLMTVVRDGAEVTITVTLQASEGAR